MRPVFLDGRIYVPSIHPMKIIAQTERLTLRELVADDAVFINEILNTPKFLQYIGDRGVRTAEQAADYIESRFRKGYADHGFGLYAAELNDGTLVGICGFVRRDSLDGPDLGFAFLPEFERKGYGLESATAMLEYGKDQLGFQTVFAITSLDNDASGRLLEKLGFEFDTVIDTPDGEKLKLFKYNF